MRAVSALELRTFLRRQLTSAHGSGRASAVRVHTFLDDQPRDVCGVKIEDLQQKIGKGRRLRVLRPPDRFALFECLIACCVVAGSESAR